MLYPVLAVFNSYSVASNSNPIRKYSCSNFSTSIAVKGSALEKLIAEDIRSRPYAIFTLTDWDNSVDDTDYRVEFKLLQDIAMSIIQSGHSVILSKDKFLRLMARLKPDKGCLSKYQNRITICNTEDKEKIESLQKSIHKICTSTPIKKLLNVVRHASQFLDEAVINKTQRDQGQQDQQDQQATQASISNTLDNLSPNERMIFLCGKLGVDGYLDLMEDKVANRFKQYFKESIANLELSLQPMITNKEREMLMNIAKCKS
ncbi:MAG: hypothetical protein EXX96DRAFT_626141 [Benjaminiella poitrasii]|nr:MAG: hypothetical protein EXX96DRAFT_626141 [Benjaminiella poitrasii]